MFNALNFKNNANIKIQTYYVIKIYDIYMFVKVGENCERDMFVKVGENCERASDVQTDLI